MERIRSRLNARQEECSGQSGDGGTGVVVADGGTYMRLFVAIQFDDFIMDALIKFQDQLRLEGLQGRYIPKENLHLTLAFIGEYGNPDDVMDAMVSVRLEPFTMALEGAGSFGDLYWAGIRKNSVLESNVKKLRHALAESNIPFDRKRFSPHITLVRKSVFQGKAALPVINPPEGEMEVESVSIMRSERGKHGMIYTELGSKCFT